MTATMVLASVQAAGELMMYLHNLSITLSNESRNATEEEQAKAHALKEQIADALTKQMQAAEVSAGATPESDAAPAVAAKG